MKRAISLFVLVLAVVWLFPGDAAAALVREPIRVIYGFDREFPPFSFEEAGGKETGFEVELLEAIFSGRANLMPRPLQWDMVPLELSAGTITVTSGMVKTDQRSKLYGFSNRATLPLQIRIFTKVYNRYPNISFLRGQTVSVEQGSYAHRLLENYGGINIKTFPDKIAPLRALYNDEVSAYCGTVQTAYYYINKLNYTGITTLGSPLGITEMRFAVNRDRGDILNMLNEGFDEVVQNGEYDRLYRKWFVTDLSLEEQEAMLKAANEAVLAAYAPYGREGRGAAVLTATGKIYSACTVENADARLAVSAVIAAASQAVAAGELELRGAVCVDARGAIITPGPEECQFLYEFGRGVLALVENEPGKRRTLMMSDMLASPVIGEVGQINIQ